MEKKPLNNITQIQLSDYKKMSKYIKDKTSTEVWIKVSLFTASRYNYCWRRVVSVVFSKRSVQKDPNPAPPTP